MRVSLARPTPAVGAAVDGLARTLGDRRGILGPPPSPQRCLAWWAVSVPISVPPTPMRGSSSHAATAVCLDVSHHPEAALPGSQAARSDKRAA